MANFLLPTLLLGLLIGLVEWPYQLLSELGFRLQQQLWPLAGLEPQPTRLLTGLPGATGPLLVFVASAGLFWLAWGPLAAGRGGGVAPVLALDQAGDAVTGEQRLRWLASLSLRSQLLRLPLMLLTHLGGLAVGVESPSAALGASLLLSLRRSGRLWDPLHRLPLPVVAAVGGAAGLGAAFRSPLLGVVYGLEELGRHGGLPLVLPALLLAGGGSLVATTLGQPARLAGLTLGPLPLELAGWAALITLAGSLLGALLVRLLVPLSERLRSQFQCRRLAMALLLALALTLLALASGGLSLNDGSLSLGQALRGQSGGGPLSLLWRGLATLLSVAGGAPGGLMHDAMTLGALLVSPLHSQPQLTQTSLAQLAAVGATALFAAANGTPLFCACFVFTLQGNPASLPLLLLVSAISCALAAPLRGEGWNAHQSRALLQADAGTEA